MISFMIALLLQPAVSALRPDLSPGAAKTITREQVCMVPFKAESSDVPAPVWSAVLQRYGVPWTDRVQYLPTLVIPSVLGGVLSADNLWPAPKTSEWNQARKQQVERRIYDELCAGHLQLIEAQQKAGVLWESSWRIYRAKE